MFGYFVSVSIVLDVLAVPADDLLCWPELTLLVSCQYRALLLATPVVELVCLFAYYFLYPYLHPAKWAVVLSFIKMLLLFTLSCRKQWKLCTRQSLAFLLGMTNLGLIVNLMIRSGKTEACRRDLDPCATGMLCLFGSMLGDCFSSGGVAVFSGLDQLLGANIHCGIFKRLARRLYHGRDGLSNIFGRPEMPRTPNLTPERKACDEANSSDEL